MEILETFKIYLISTIGGIYVDADTYVYLLCPICGNQVGIDDCIDNYCSDCGHKLDWSDEE